MVHAHPSQAAKGSNVHRIWPSSFQKDGSHLEDGEEEDEFWRLEGEHSLGTSNPSSEGQNYVALPTFVIERDSDTPWSTTAQGGPQGCSRWTPGDSASCFPILVPSMDEILKVDPSLNESWTGVGASF